MTVVLSVFVGAAVEDGVPGVVVVAVESGPVAVGAGVDPVVVLSVLMPVADEAGVTV